jgi:hypothetical protein
MEPSVNDGRPQPRLLEQPRDRDWPQRLAPATLRRGASAKRVASDETPALLPLPRVQPQGVGERDDEVPRPTRTPMPRHVRLAS